MKEIALIFPGQGSQYVGMGKKYFDRFSMAKATFDEASSILGFDLGKLCFEGDVDELTLTENAQPAILATSIVAFNVFMQETCAIPSFFAGHSLGEITALVCSGAIKFSDAIKIVRTRGIIMRDAAMHNGCTVAIMGTEASVIENECRKISAEGRVVAIANFNSPEQIVISGNEAAVSKVASNLERMGGRTMPVNIRAAFHCSLVESAKRELRNELIKYTYNVFKYPVMSNVSALPYENERCVVDNLSEQIVRAVRWQESLEYIAKKGVTTFIEVGPQAILRNLLMTNNMGIEAFSYDDKNDVELILQKTRFEAEVGHCIERKRKEELIARCLAIAICTENRNWNSEEFKKGVIEPYRNVKRMLDDLERNDIAPANEQMKEALEMLKAVFETKLSPIEERKDRFRQVLYGTGLFDFFPEYLDS